MTVFTLPLAWAQITVTHVHVETVTDRYGETVTTETESVIDGCLHAPAHSSEDDHRVINPATLYLPGSHSIADTDHFIYPGGERWEVLGGGSDWQAGTTVPVRRWGRSAPQGGDGNG